MKIPQFPSKSELFKFLKENKSLLIAEKKYGIKHGDVVAHYVFSENGVDKITKAIEDPSQFKGNELGVTLVINTTNLMDSHSDVHIPGIWSKSLKENKNIYLLQEHSMSFKGIIADGVRASAKYYNWNDLGYNAPGSTQALIFNATISKDQNEYMFDQYLKGRVKNHSVGMQYVKIDLAMNSDSKYDAAEKAIWDKYIDQVVNRSDAEDQGYFFPVTEAKVIEGSAVPIGSNFVTPTLSVNEKHSAAASTETEPVKTTHAINYNYLKSNLK